MKVKLLLLFLIITHMVFAYEPKIPKPFLGKGSGNVVNMRFPSLSPDGKWIAFALYGDIWKVASTGGRAVRLTLNQADDVKPRWSPDGKTIAFASRRNGNFDIWIVPATGGVPEQLTYHSGWDSISDWSPDGKWILFYSFRTGSLELWKIRKTGGMPIQVTFDVGRDGDISPDGKKVAYCRGEVSMWIKGYKGSSNWDIYTTSMEKREIPRQLTTFPGNDLYPQYAPDGKSLYFIRETNTMVEKKQVPVYNLWQMDVLGKSQRQITRFQTSIFGPHLSRDGKKMVFEKDFQVWELDLTTMKAKKIEIIIASDNKFPVEKTQIVTQGSNMGHWSSDASQITFMLGGDIWIMSALGGRAKQITNTPYKEEWPRFSPDGNYIAYFSDKSGNKDIYILDLKTHKTRQFTKHKADDFYHSWSPDGKHMLFTSERSGNRDIWLMPVKGGMAKQLTNSKESEDDAVFSPDGKWIAFDSAKSGNQEIWLMPANGTYADAKQLTKRPGLTQVPSWSPDGNWIAFEYNDRLGRSGIWVISRKGGVAMQVVGKATLPCWSPDGKWILYESEQTGVKNLCRIEAPSNIKSGRIIPFFAQIQVNIKSEREKIFEESWLAIKNGFYDPTFHGVDWDKIKTKYKALLAHVKTDLEFNLLINRMTGELRSSHVGITGRSPKNKVQTGYLGWILAEVPGQKILRVKDILVDGPAYKPWIREGDYIFQIAGKLISKEVNIHNILNGKIGQKVKIFVSPSIDYKKGRYVYVKPVNYGAIEKIKYRHTLLKRIALVRKKCRGQVLYIHLREMNMAYLKRFREIVKRSVHIAKGMILDVRDNGGGNIHQELLDILTRKPFLAYKERNQKTKKYQPALYWNKPIVVIINEKSFSDAEVFPYAFKELKLGHLVGMPTSGGVIGTRDITLSDNSTFRVPQVGYYTLTGKNMEGMGVKPDYIVPETPEDRAKGRDPQLEKAIEVIMREIFAQRTLKARKKLKAK